MQKWLSMIADVNDGQVAEAVKDDDELSRICLEVNRMRQDKEVQSVLIKEKYDRMMLLSYGDDREAEGEKKGLKEGEKKGEAKGINEFAKVAAKLIALGRSDEVVRASEDAAYMADLCKEFGIA